jgi:hypothetical protein
MDFGLLRAQQLPELIFPRARTTLCIGSNGTFSTETRMLEDDRSYYQHRAEVETERAEQASLPCAVEAHYKLAEAYLDKLASFDRDGESA